MEITNWSISQNVTCHRKDGLWLGRFEHLQGMVALSLPLALWDCEQSCLGDGYFWGADNKPRFNWAIVLLYTEGCCCRYTTIHIQKMKGKLFCNNSMVRYVKMTLLFKVSMLVCFSHPLHVHFFCLIDLKYTKGEYAIIINTIYGEPVVCQTQLVTVCYNSDTHNSIK